jgi:hypothetical protein
MMWVRAMRFKPLPAGLILTTGLACALGCQSDSSRLTYSRDPLLVTKKPIEGKPDNSEFTLLAAAEPIPPRLPAQAYVSAPPASGPAPEAVSSRSAHEERPEADSPVHSPAPAWLMSRTKDLPEVKGVPVARHKGMRVFGHAPDHSWLRGILDQSESGELELYYEEEQTEEKWHGRVILEDDERLRPLRPGDGILVEGALLPEVESRTSEPEPAWPRYRIRAVWLIERGGDSSTDRP